MNVIARTDPHAVHQDVYDAHPDWIAVDATAQNGVTGLIPSYGLPARWDPTISSTCRRSTTRL